MNAATPRGGQHLRRVVDDAARPQTTVERHLDHHLTVGAELLREDRAGPFWFLELAAVADPRQATSN
jgi:hypothetical protein